MTSYHRDSRVLGSRLGAVVAPSPVGLGFTQAGWARQTEESNQEPLVL